MPSAHDLLNLAALVLAGVAGALLTGPIGGAMRVVAAQVRIESRKP